MYQTVLTMGKQFTVTIVRHGETLLNVQRVLQGHTNTPLSEVGIKQAQLLGQKIQGQTFSKVFSSDLTRAHHTAQLILEHSGNPSQIVQDPRLRERSFGSSEGKPVEDYLQEAKRLNIHIQEYNPEGAETVTEVQNRAASFLEHICQEAKNCDDMESILVVTHGGWIQYLMKHLHRNNGNKYILENFDPSKAITIHRNTAVSRLVVRHEDHTKKPSISFVDINNASHLEDV